MTEPTIAVATRHFDLMMDRLLRIRALHQPVDGHGPFCLAGCSHAGHRVGICNHCRTSYPCATARILDGADA